MVHLVSHMVELPFTFNQPNWAQQVSESLNMWSRYKLVIMCHNVAWCGMMWSRHNGRKFDSEIQCAHTKTFTHLRKLSSQQRLIIDIADICQMVSYHGIRLPYHQWATTPHISGWPCWNIKMYTQYPLLFKWPIWGGIGATDSDHPFDRFRLKGEHQRNRCPK